MDADKHIRIFDVRRLLRLSNRLHQVRDLVEQKREMLRGMCGLVEARGGVGAVWWCHPRTQKIFPVSIVEHPAREPEGEDRVLGLFPNYECASAQSPDRRNHSAVAAATLALSRQLFDHRDSDVPLQSQFALAGGSGMAVVRLICRGGFDRRRRTLVHLFHREMSWIYQVDVQLASSGALDLSPRKRQTLTLLLAGDSEKEIAMKLKVRPNTIHTYVKELHRHFSVSSRGELLARWVTK